MTHKNSNNRQLHSGSDPACGFAIHACGEPDGEYNAVRLLVPISLHNAFEAERRARDELERHLESKEADREDDETRLSARNPRPPKSLEARQKAQAAAEQAAETAAQQALWNGHAAAVRLAARRRNYPVFQPDQAMALYHRMGRYLKEDRERYQRVYDHMRANGNLRAVAHPSDAELQHLAVSQPHMAPVVEFVRTHIGLARCSRKPLRIPPMLLVGEPGIGKTHFAQALAKALAAPLSIQRLDSDLTGALLLGSDCKWGNSQHGLLFELLVLGSAANPVVVLDEIDKFNRPDHQVQASLYSLLEPVSACRLRDISLEFEFDASLVTWIATANDVTRLNEPLRSRFKEFHIALPNAEQCLVLAREVMTATIRDLDMRGFVVETNRMERHLAHLPARQIQQLTREAVAQAVLAGRTSLQRGDLPRSVLEADGADVSPDPYLH